MKRVVNIFEDSATSSKWWGYHVRVPPISQVKTNTSWQTWPSHIPPWRIIHRELPIILSMRDPHEMSGGHHMSILMKTRQISSPSYFTPVKNEKVFSETFYTISFRRMQRRQLSHMVYTKTTMIHTTHQSDSVCRNIRTTICWSSSCGRATFLFILRFYILKIVIPTWYFFCFIFLPKADVTHVRWTTKTLLYVLMRKLYHSPR